MKTIFLAIVLLILLMAPTVSIGGTIVATSCQQLDVLAAIKAARDGDIVQVPAQTCVWNTAITVDVGITLMGAGPGQSVIDCAVPTGTGQGGMHCIELSNTSGSPVRLTGFTFLETQEDNYNSQGILRITTTVDGWRVDNNIFRGMNYRVLTVYETSAHGLIAQNEFHDSGDQVMRFYPSYAQGQVAWSTETHIGGSDATHIEDNVCTNSNEMIDMVDAENGAKLVIRYNDLQDCRLEAHGPDGSLGVLRYEVYRNNFSRTVSDPNKIAVNWRGGTGIVFDNSIVDSGIPFWQVFSSVYYCGTENCRDVTGCHTTVPGPEACTDYPCKNQMGRTYNMELEPVLYFGNTFNGALYNSLHLHEADTTASGVCAPGSLNYKFITESTAADRDFYTQSISFDGTSGVGVGPVASRPSTCTTGVRYWATDEGEWNSESAGADGQLYVCGPDDTWDLYFVPYTYPHPLRETPPTRETGIGSGAGGGGCFLSMGRN